jgi:hypothetical protein
MADLLPLHDPVADSGARFLAGETAPVKSSNVAWLRYDAENETLFIGYKNGGEYERDGVDGKLALEIRKAKSVGKALHALQGSHGVFKKVEK